MAPRSPAPPPATTSSTAPRATPAWTSVPTVDTDAGGGSSDETVSQALSGLDPNTAYHARLVATRLLGAGFKVSSEIAFTTDALPPVVTDRSAFPVTDTAATLRGAIDPEHSATTYWFEYGPDDCSSNPCTSVPAGQDGDAGSRLGAKAFATQITGLQPQTTYHFRLFAKNQADPDPVMGEDVTFTTQSAAEAAWPTRGIELVNSPDKANQPVILQVVPGPIDNNHVVWGTATGTSTSSSGMVGTFLATRTSSGWQSDNLMPTSTYEGLLGALVPIDRQAIAKERLLIDPIAHTPDYASVLYAVRNSIGGDQYGRRRFQLGLGQGRLPWRHRGRLESAIGNPQPRGVTPTAATDDLQRLFIEADHRFSSAQANGTFGIYEVSSGSPVIVDKLPGETVPSCGVDPQT